MAPKKDQRRLNLVVPYQAPNTSGESSDVSSSMSSIMPMAAMMTRNRYIGWGSVIYSVMSWLGESEDAKKSSSTPGIFAVGMSLMALVVTYIPMFLPPTGPKAAAAVPVAVA